MVHPCKIVECDYGCCGFVGELDCHRYWVVCIWSLTTKCNKPTLQCSIALTTVSTQLAFKCTWMFVSQRTPEFAQWTVCDHILGTCKMHFKHTQFPFHTSPFTDIGANSSQQQLEVLVILQVKRTGTWTCTASKCQCYLQLLWFIDVKMSHKHIYFMCYSGVSAANKQTSMSVHEHELVSSKLKFNLTAIGQRLGVSCMQGLLCKILHALFGAVVPDTHTSLVCVPFIPHYSPASPTIFYVHLHYTTNRCVTLRRGLKENSWQKLHIVAK